MGGLVQKSIEYFGVDQNQYVDMKEDMIHQLAKEVC
jgi:hypothetical protein